MTASPTSSPVTAPEPVVVVREYYRLVDADDIEGLLALFEPTAAYDRPGYEQLSGHDQIETFYRSQRVIESGRHTINNLVADGPEVAVQGTFEGRLRDGREVSLQFADFFSLTANGRFATRRTFFFTPLV